MLVRVKLKNLTTDIAQMGFNHVVPLIQVTYDTQKSKNGFQVRYMYVKKCRDMAYPIDWLEIFFPVIQEQISFLLEIFSPVLQEQSYLLLEIFALVMLQKIPDFTK